MKMKKIILMFSMIAVFLSLTACSDGQEKVTFDYTDTSVIQATLVQAYQVQNMDDSYRAYFENSQDEKAAVMLTGLNNMENAEKECGNFIGYRTVNGDCVAFADVLSAEDVDSALLDLITKLDATVEESNGNVLVTVTAVYDDRDVDYTFVYEENPAYSYAGLIGQSVEPFQIKEMNITPQYTQAEKMGKAGANTLMGMGTVFVILIFISLIIGQFGKINKLVVMLENRKSAKEEQVSVEAQVAAPVATAPVSIAESMDDTQLVAVITAAVVAANVASGGSDRLIVRSIKKAKR